MLSTPVIFSVYFEIKVIDLPEPKVRRDCTEKMMGEQRTGRQNTDKITPRSSTVGREIL